MADSTVRARSRKVTGRPKKPRPDFPLFPHATGRWAKKVRGKFSYFGKVADDPKGDAALVLWLDQKDELLAGRTPRVAGDGLKVRDLCNRFLTSKKLLLENGEIIERSFQDYHRTCETLVTQFGKNRLVDDLAADDFEALRSSLAKTNGPVALGGWIQRVRMVFKYANDQGLTEKTIRYGQGFKRPSRKTLRKSRAANSARNGQRMFEAAELRAIINAAKQPLKSMILLAANCAFGATDISQLPKSAIDLDRSVIDFPRPKTWVSRRIPLWKETVQALREAIANRPNPKDSADDGLAFVTKYGLRWVKLTKTWMPDDAIGKEFAKVLRALNLKRAGVSFYAIRHGWRTVADETRDFPAIDHIMGHTRDDMATRYCERIGDDRLQAVVNHVRDWLFGTKESP